MAPPPLKNFHAQIVDLLGARIVTGQWPPGQQLPTEAELAEHFGASRLLIREAMKSLAAKGLVRIRPRIGTHVQPRSDWNLFDAAVLAWHAQAPLRTSFIADLMELRTAIEPLAARLAAHRADEPAILALSSAFRDMAGAADKDAYMEADLRFHSEVLRACGNAFIRQLSLALAEVLKTSFSASIGEWAGPDAPALTLHESLLHAIRDHDAAAAEHAAHALIARATERIRRGLLARAQDGATGHGDS